MSTLRHTIGLVALAGAFAVLGLFLNTGSAHADSGLNWDAVAQCESGGNWAANTGNGAYGGLQFKPATWASHGGQGSPASASREDQIRIAEKVVAKQGVGAWPKCGAVAGTPASLTPVYQASSPAPTVCQGFSRGPLGLFDFAKMCQAFTDPGAALANAFGVH